MRKSSNSSGAPRAVAEGILAVMKAAPFACALLFVSPAQLWAPDVVSTPQSEVRITFSPDGKRMLWGAIGWSSNPGNTGGGWDIYESERAGSGWSKPRVVSFNSSANDFDPSFAPDGSGVDFFSNREGGFGKDDIYFASFDARAGLYGIARNLGAAINSAGDEWAPVVAPDGKRLLFASDGHGGRGKHDLFVARRAGERWEHIESLEALNTPDEDFDATFLHDGVSVVYTSGKFETDDVALYVAEFRDGHFRPRQRLPAAVNSPKAGAWTLGPSISPHDPGVLYFTSQHAEGRGRADIYRIEYRY
jgi:TolB protein